MSTAIVAARRTLPSVSYGPGMGFSVSFSFKVPEPTSGAFAYMVSKGSVGTDDSLNFFFDSRVDGTSGETCTLRVLARDANEVNAGNVYFQAGSDNEGGLCDDE